MKFDFAIVIQFMPEILAGFLQTLLLCFAGCLIGIPIAVLLCLGRLDDGPYSRLCNLITDTFRSMPEMIILFWVYYCVPLIFDLRLSPVGAGLIGLTCYAASNLSEIFRSGIRAVPKGQVEAAFTLGLPERDIWLKVVVPQALRAMTGPFVTFGTSLLKVSGLLSSIGVAEMTYRATVISGQNYKYLELFTAVGAMYFIVIFPLSMLAQRFELKSSKW
ncbi:amino acid ABC transporter permease [Xinfangfangia sp. CPCC 101601]|uniref:Amino acid ABC transporter permease n=1 Tax=Pseudogemmobacter lacusdianii TaxID=3069608 RepID=A0ABU0W555_9RHOB|nr:amino acid ABC transporter permease [Xinfangfangia sp. CPCC 101601]MDQ2068190.1 amino acid ABC transporter permease [Xinfangfangia sp. CPCC 101601]